MSGCGSPTVSRPSASLVRARRVAGSSRAEAWIRDIDVKVATVALILVESAVARLIEPPQVG
jgi:hypothetical protein